MTHSPSPREARPAEASSGDDAPRRTPRSVGRIRADGDLLLRTAGDLLRSPLEVLQMVRRTVRDPTRHREAVDPARWHCRVGRAGAPCSERVRTCTGTGPHVVLVGKGYGELRLLERIDTALRERQPDVTTTWCGLTAEFHAGAASLRPGQSLVPLPFDALPSVARWVANVRPDVVVFVERFWYPVLAGGAATAGARLVAANAIGWHHSAGSGLGGALEARSRRRIAARFAALGFQSRRQAEHARPYLADGVPAVVTGNVKLDLPPLAADPARDAALATWLGAADGRPLLAAASTRKGDEPFVLEAFAAVRRERPCALLLAPREMHRIPLVEDLLRKAGLVASRRSRPVGGADVYLLDTVGELGAALAHARAAFVGGTLRHLGQNFVEPLQHGLHVAFGRAPVLLMDEQRACADAGLGTWVDTPADLAAHWRAALDDVEPSAERRARVDAFLAAHRGALGRTVDLILQVTPRGASLRAATVSSGAPGER